MYARKNIIILHKENQQNLPQIGKLFLKQSIGLRYSNVDISRSRSKLKNAHDRIEDLRFLSYNFLLRLRVGAARSLKMPESVVVVVVVVVVVDGVTNRLLDK